MDASCHRAITACIMHPMARRRESPKKGQTPIGARLYAARREIGMTQEDLHYRVRRLLPESLHPSMSTISRIEAGLIKHPQTYIVAAMATVLGKQLREIAPELVDEARSIHNLIDLTCAPSELNREPAVSEPDPNQLVFSGADAWHSGGSSVPRLTEFRDAQPARTPLAVPQRERISA